MTNECVESLANAIVLQAVKDYREVLQVLKSYPKYEKAITAEEEIEFFFRSEWFQTLSGMDGIPIMERLQKEV